MRSNRLVKANVLKQYGHASHDNQQRQECAKAAQTVARDQPVHAENDPLDPRCLDSAAAHLHLTVVEIGCTRLILAILPALSEPSV
jgi:hypothetical protein